MKLLSALFVLSFLFSPTAHATKEEDRIQAIEDLKTSQPSILNSYLDLMEKNKMMHQEDVRLKERLLLKRDGGLCGFTAMTDTLEAFSEYYQVAKSKFEGRPDYVLYQVMEKTRNNTGIDGAHAGAVLSDLATYTNELLSDYNLDQLAKIGYTNNKDDMNPEKFDMPWWKLRLVGVTSNNGKEGHTMVVIGKDLDKKILYISDPNFPNIVTPIRYEYSQREGLRMYLNVKDFGKDFAPCIVDELLELDILQ